MVLKHPPRYTLSDDVVNAAVIFAHIVALSITAFRVSRRVRFKQFWMDDALAAFIGLCNALLMCLTAKDVVVRYAGEINTVFRITVSIHFVVVWSSRACIALSIARIFHYSNIKPSSIAVFSVFLLLMAITFFALSLGLCDLDNCSAVDEDICVCFPSKVLLFASIVCDFVVDVGLSIRGYIFLKTVVVYPKSWRNKFVVSGYSSGIVIFVFSSMAWILHLCSQVDRPLILMQLLQFSSVNALTACSHPMLAAFVLRKVLPDRSCRPGETFRYPIFAYAIEQDADDGADM